MIDLIFSWSMLWIIMWALYLPACVGLIVIVLLQKGKSSGFAGAFGVGGGSETVFGPRARKSLPVKATYVMATLFMVLAMGMSLVAGRVHRGAAPEAVVVDETLTSDQIYDALLSGGTEAETPSDVLSLTPMLDPTVPAENPDQPVTESPADDAPAVGPSDAAPSEEAESEPASDAAAEGAASAS
jgi:preprotein translocase subunit SecG